MIQIKYYDMLEMEPRFNQKFFTTYYKIDMRSKSKLQDHIEEVIAGMTQAHIDGAFDMYEPIAEFKKTRGNPGYSAYEIITDLQKQLSKNKDATKAMIGRWNRLLPEELGIELVKDE
jgi:hypothetical protein